MPPGPAPWVSCAISSACSASCPRCGWAVAQDRRRAICCRSACLGVGQFGLLIVLLNYSLLHIPAARASLLFATFPLMTMLLSALLGREAIDALRKVGGSLLTFVGVAIALGGAALAAAAAARHRPGSARCRRLGAAFCGAVCSICYARLRRSLFRAACNGLRDVRRGPGAGGEPPLPKASSPTWPRFTVGGVARRSSSSASRAESASSCGSMRWAMRRRLGHDLPGLGPVTAALGGTMLLGEPLPVAALLGLAFVLAGLWWALKPNQRAG